MSESWHEEKKNPETTRKDQKGLSAAELSTFCGQVALILEAGLPLYDALKTDGRWPEYLVEMVGIGERSGQLEKVMRGLEEAHGHLSGPVGHYLLHAPHPGPAGPADDRHGG